MAEVNRPRFFSTSKKGENYELKVELNSEYRDKRKEAVKKVIANMTIGKDVSDLFADVVKNMQTEDLELKKLVYLYLINYAKSQPELVILAVNTFVKDSDDPNPLIRALAIRTMGCLRVEKIIDYLMEPLKKSIQDQDPYVRKTAAICVAKLFDLNPSIAIENGLIQSLQDLLSDRNPVVIANAVAALAEISEAAVQKDIFVINDITLAKLMAAINECTEWGQVCILNSFATYRPKDAKEASDIIERVVPRLQHVNASVVLAAVKVLMVYLGFRFGEEVDQSIVKKLAPPLVTLLSTESEIQYVALRNINLILQKRPDLLRQETRVFFTKYNDPPFVKREKLQVLVKLASVDNVDQILSELREYCNEVDVDFVRKSVRAIGGCAIKIPEAADKCVQVILDLIKTGVNYIVQEAVVTTKDIFRKYPMRYEGIIPTLCEHLETLDEPDARASLIWIVGEYADRIENASALLEHFLEDFKDHVPKVQLQLIAATVKLFLKRPGSAQQLVQQVLQDATQANENPDIRDRAYVYWRLLSADPQKAQQVVLAEKPPIEFDSKTVSDSLLDELLFNISSLASVYHKSPALVGGASYVDMSLYRDAYEDDELDRRQVLQQAAQQLGGPIIENLLDLDAEVIQPVQSNTTTPLHDLLGNVSVNHETLLSAETANGLSLKGSFAKRDGLYLDLVFENKAQSVMNDFAIQFNVNTYGITPAQALVVPDLVGGQKYETSLLLANTGGKQQMDPPNLIQIAIKNNLGVYYFQMLYDD
ncbi:adaptin N terminal region-domain-containing protein [Gorgonomyces haynaldii]|nr:adaptin N terminal region-domain-containing protein [Gorgonomyces haynaldii]